MSGPTSLTWGFFLAASLSVTIVLVAFVAATLVAQRQRIKMRREQATLIARAHDAERVGVAATLEQEVLNRIGSVRSHVADLRERLEGARGTAVDARFIDIDRELEDVAVAAHLVATRLHPKVVDQVGLAMALQALAEEVQRDGGIEVTFEMEGMPPRLDPEVARVAYRIAQDALRNVVKHSGAKGAELAVDFSDRWVTIRVRDDGAGFDPTSGAAAKGFGLMTMREQALSVGGKARIESDSGAGTLVEATLPAMMR